MTVIISVHSFDHVVIQSNPHDWSSFMPEAMGGGGEEGEVTGRLAAVCIYKVHLFSLSFIAVK